MKVCELCSIEYKQRRNEQRYCSRKCRGEHDRQQKRINKVCLVCEKVFWVWESVNKIGKGKYCSKECRIIYLANNRRVETICIVCETVFSVWKSHAKNGAKYCSRECTFEGQHLNCTKYDNVGNVVEKKCSTCQSWFPPSEYWSSKSTKSGLCRDCKICSLRHDQKRKYNMTDKELEALPDYCEVCGSQENLHIDHCHKTGIVRGRLCQHCNRALGLLYDDSERIIKLAQYLQRDRK